MKVKIVLAALALATAGLADTLVLRSGRVVAGNFLGATPRQIRMDVGDRVETFDVSDVASINFGELAALPVRSVPSAYSADPMYGRAGASEIPAGTRFVVRMIDGVDSDRDRVGQTFHASLDEPVYLNGEQAIPRGSDAVVRLVDSRASGRLAGRASLALHLASVRIGDRMVDVNTQTVTEVSSSRTARTAKMGVGGAAVGAAIGAIAGGGEGALIGAGAGTAAGIGTQAITKGQQVRIPSETRLTFILEASVRF